MKTSKHIQGLLARWPADGLAHDHARRDGEGFDIRRSELMRWIMDQPEAWTWLFEYANARGWLMFRDGKWWAGDAAGPGRSALYKERMGKEGTGKEARDKLPPALLLACLTELGGVARWDEWRKLAQERGGVKVGKLWGFYHAIRPLLTSGRVMKHAGRYKLAIPDNAPASEKAAYSVPVPRELAARVHSLIRCLPIAPRRLTADEWRTRSGLSPDDFAPLPDAIAADPAFDNVVGSDGEGNFWIFPDAPGFAPAVEEVDL
jgi:hypothetical protein